MKAYNIFEASDANECHCQQFWCFTVVFLRFRDNYWINRGLLLCEMYETVKGTIRNFFEMVDAYGFIPNGGRIYYTRRSQPPFLSLMVQDYVRFSGIYLRSCVNLLLTVSTAIRGIISLIKYIIGRFSGKLFRALVRQYYLQTEIVENLSCQISLRAVNMQRSQTILCKY